MADPELDEARRGGTRRTLWAEVLAYVAAAGASLAGAAWTLRLWDATASRPWFGTGDALLQTGAVKGILDHGWYWSNPDLGVPWGLHLVDFTTFNGDFTQMSLIRVIGVLVGGPFSAANLFFLLTFPLVAVSALFALRSLELSRWVAVVVATLYALLPYHFERNVSHLYLTGYYTVPLLCVLVLDIVAGRPLVERRAEGGRATGLLTTRTLRTVGICVLIGTTSAYYSAFSLILLTCATLVSLLITRRWRAVYPGLLAMLLVTVCIGFVQLPGLVNGRDAGPLVGQRAASESESYGLKLDQLVFPVAEHRLTPLADLARRYESTTPLASEPASNVGLVGVVGLAWLLVVALGSLAGGRERRIGNDEERRIAVMTGITFLIATVGGGSALLAWMVTPQVRAWNRMSVFIAFFAFTATAFLLDRLRVRARERRVGTTILAVGLGAVLVVGVLDQTVARFAPAYAEADARQSTVDRFVADAEAVLPDGAAVLQLPYIPYPEYGSVNAMADYEHLRAYLGSHDLRFSYPTVKGSTDDWHGPLAGAPLDVVLDAAAAIGFDAVYVDRSAYTDQAEVLARSLDDALGDDVARSTDDRLLLWNLRDRRADLRERLGASGVERLRAAVTHPVRAFLDRGFGTTSAAVGSGSRDAEPEAEITLDNGLDRSRRVVLDTELATLPNGATSATLVFPDGSRRRVRLGAEPTRVTHAFRAPSGRSTVRIVSRGAPDIDMRDTASWHGAVGVPTTFESRAVTRVTDPSVIPLDACAGQAATGLGRVDACTEGSRPQIP